jgi:nucleoside transporter
MNKARLMAMMFLEFFIWGAWYVTVGNYMAKIGLTGAIYWAYTVSPIGAIISPFFLGMIADRFFATEKVLGVLHLVGGIAMFLAPFAAEGASASPAMFITLLLIHMLCYMPTVGLANSLAFHHIKSQEKEFPIIRAFGTVGWIVAGVIVSAVLEADETSMPLRIAGLSGILMGLFSFTLPHTPPPATGEKVTARQILGLDALSRLKSRPFNVFIVSSFLICIPLAAYYSYAPVFVNAAGISDPAFKMSFGQVSETFFIVVMPFFFARLGVKWMLFTGMLAWVLRYALFSIGAPDAVLWMIMTGVILHGICYDFFFVAGQIYVDKKATPAIRGQAQGFLVFVTYGVGMLIGAQVSGWIFNAIVTGSGAASLPQYQTFWLIPAVFAAGVLLMFGALFNDKIVNAEK